MKNSMKIWGLSLLVCAGSFSGIQADDNDPYLDNYAREMSIMQGHPVNETEQPATGYYLNTIKNCTYATAKFVAQTSYSAGLIAAEKVGRYGLAYYASYAGVEMLAEATAWSVWLSAYGVGCYTTGPAGGLIAGNAAYTVARTALKGARYIIPGIDGAIAAAYTPVVKLFTDTAIDMAPTVARKTYSAVKTVASVTSSVSSYIWNYFTPKAA